jgi:alkylation response protein AidB-like acyl-CoA dehydrogenase
MCLLYSEPGAGSDLAGLRTRADRVDGGWRITGQKVWTSEAHVARRGFLLARTNWDVPKHRGISFFLLPMHQHGIEVRGIRQITGDSRFNEVFIDGAFVADEDRLGGVDEGWAVLQTALALERAAMGADRARARATVSRDQPNLDCLDLARVAGRAAEPLVRQALANLYCRRLVHLWNGQRARATGAAALASLDKLSMSRLLHLAARVEADVLGARSLLCGPQHPEGDHAAHHLLNAYFTSIGGGTDQIQQNVIGERVLGLAREPNVDHDIPFRDVPASAHTPARRN